MNSTSSRRPYFNKNIEELSTLVQANKENKKVLKQILHELSFRSRPRAKALAKTVTAILEAGAVQEQLTLPLNPPGQKSHNGCGPQPLPMSTDAEPEEAPTPGAPQQETMSEESAREAPLSPDADLPPPPVSLWDKLVEWFKSR